MSTILVVDDRPDARYALVRVLTSAGFDVRETATGRDALRLARSAPDLIVLDIALQDMDGFEVCRRLKAEGDSSAIPVVNNTEVFVDAMQTKLGLAEWDDDCIEAHMDEAVQ